METQSATKSRLTAGCFFGKIFKNEVSEMVASEAKIRANARYSKKVYDTVKFMVRKDAVLSSTVIKEYATSHGESINNFVIRAIKAAIKHDEIRNGSVKSDG